MEKMPYGIMFHHFYRDGENVPGYGAITAADLRRIIESIGAENILQARLWQERAVNNSLEDGDVCLTFDDALKSQVNIALPVLEEYGLTAFWFIYSSVFSGHIEKFEIYKCFYNKYFPDMEAFYRVFKEAVADCGYGQLFSDKIKEFTPGDYLREFGFYSETEREYRFARDRILGREKFETVMDSIMEGYKVDIKGMAGDLWMDNDDLINLAKTGHVIGLHSFSHPTDLKSLTYSQQEKEYRLNRDHVEEVTGESPLSMSHPCNSYNQDTLDILSMMGIKIGFKSNFAGTGDSVFEYPREDHSNILNALNINSRGKT